MKNLRKVKSRKRQMPKSGKLKHKNWKTLNQKAENLKINTFANFKLS